MNKKVIELLNYIDPSKLSYTEWIEVGMALKAEGVGVDVWNEWSSKDVSRYRDGECYSKWNTFNGSGVTGGTIYQMAIEQGLYIPFEKEEGSALEWNSTITKDYDDEYRIIDKSWIEAKEIKEPNDNDWNPSNEIIRYLETLFDPNDYVNYVTSTYQKVDDKTGEITFKPTKGNSDRTAGELIQEINKYKGDIGAVFGDYKKEVGAWIRFNPVDGKGIQNSNVTSYKYALVESDSMNLAKQNAIIRELELPVATLVFSGKKSIHAIVRIEAQNYNEYQKRVDFLYKICKKNGLNIDTQNKNPSRLSRMPGVVRGEHKQFLIDTNIGKSSWNEWFDWIEDLNDDLPDPEGLESYWNKLPPLANPLIEGILRQGHKMLIAGPSKAGKSFALIELTIAIAEGGKWLGWQCSRGRVLYVNLELDRASCLHRFKDVYDSLNISPNNINNIDIWNLRGKSVPMDKLAPKLIRRASKKNYIAVIIDPIYKVITGDENSADQMAHFTNQFDKICAELNTAVIYCHHHSKGSQGGKRSMDRASGSGVFARDPDALIDLIELELDKNIIDSEINLEIRKLCVEYLKKYVLDYQKELSQDDLVTPKILLDYCKNKLDKYQYNRFELELEKRKEKAKNKTGWRLDGILREFPKFKSFDMWFEYPLHKIDESGILQDVDPDDGNLFKKKKKVVNEKKKEEKKQSEIEIAFSNLELDGIKDITINDLAEELEISEKTVRRRLKEIKHLEIERVDGKTSFIRRKK